jgi:hypothetical protein
MFEYSYDLPHIGIDFSHNDIIKASQIASDIWEEETYELLEKYDNPFWIINASEHDIRIEIHADLSETDSEIVENEFKVSVHKAMHILIGRE